MSPRGKARAKKDVDVEENGKEKRVRESRNVKAASYKDLSDSEDEKPRRRKKDSDSESPFEDEKPVKKAAAKGKRGRPRARKQEVSDSEEGSEFGGSDESSGEESSSKRRKSVRKPAARSLRAQRGTSYKDLSNSEEESGAESKSSSGEDESPKKTKKGRAASKTVMKGKSKKKEELSESGSENEDEEEEREEDEEEEEDGSVKSKSVEKGASDNKKDTSAKKKQQGTDEEESNGKVESKSKPAAKKSDDEEEVDEEEEEEDSDKEESKKEETESKKRSRSVKNSEGVADEETEDKPPSKKAKVEDKPKMNKTESSFETIDFSSEAKTKDGEPWNLKISSWNVAGLRACIKKNGLDFVKYENPDIMCLQETKCSEKKLPPEAKVAGYESYWLSGEKEGHAGVAILSKVKPLYVTYGVGNPDFDNDGRVITAEYEKFFVVNAYVPNAGQGLKTLPRRLEWDPIFRAHLKKLDEQKPVILCGDLNVAHNEIDLTNPKTNAKTAGFTPQEREGMTTLLKEGGFVDTFRNLYPDRTGAYSFWSYFNNARSRNIGWRLDYFITSERFLPSVCDNVIRSEVYGSDHCPITLFVHV